MKREKTNLLYKITTPQGDVHWFTTRNKAGDFIDVVAASIDYAVIHYTKPNGNTVELVDGSEIKWKDINNL